MKRFYALLLTLCLLTGFALAESADITKQLLEEQLEILGIENMEDEFPPEMKNVVWRKGGTTQELIDDQTWDVAEVSSLQVDLKALTDAGVIWRSDYLCPDASALNPMLKLDILRLVTAEGPADNPPNHMPESTRIMAIPYRADGDDVTLLIFNGRKSLKEERLQLAANYVTWYLQKRSPATVKSLQTLVFKDGGDMGMLSTSPEDWDIARVFASAVDLAALDQAGVLTDGKAYQGFAEYYERLLPEYQGLVTAEDGRMIAVPLISDSYSFGADGSIIPIPMIAKLELLLINAKGSHLQEAADYVLWYMEFMHDKNSSYIESVANPK